MSTNILKAMGFNFGVAHLEFRIVNGEPILLEVNGRLGGGTTNDIIYYSTGIDLFKALVDITVGNIPDIKRKYNKCVAVKRIQLKEGVIKDISGFEDAKAEKGVKLVHQWMYVGDRVRTTTRDVGGAVLGIANTPQEALDIVENAVNKIKFTIE